MLDLARAKQHLRVLHSDDDDLIQAYLDAAKRWAENYTGQLIDRREVVRHFAAFGGGIAILDGPNPDISSISYLDAAGLPQPWTDYRLVALQNPVVLPAVGGSWPAVGSPAGIAITLTAGYEDDDLPEDLQAAILLLVGHLYANRETVAPGSTPAEIPFGSTILADPYRAHLV